MRDVCEHAVSYDTQILPDKFNASGNLKRNSQQNIDFTVRTL